MAGDVFGCAATESCFEGTCTSCTTAEVAKPVECGAQGALKINFVLVNPKITSTLVVCNQNVTVAAPAGCGVQWQPQAGVGVDCSSSPDGRLTTSPDEKLLLSFSPPMNKIKLTFGSFVPGQSAGSVLVRMNAPMGTRRRQAMQEIAFNESSLLIDQQAISGLEIRATSGAFDFRTLEQVEMTTVTSMNDTTMPLSTIASAVTATDDSLQRTDTDTTVEKGFIDNLNDGFAGTNDVYLGGFIGFLAFLILCIVGVVVVIVLWPRKSKAAAKVAKPIALKESNYGAVNVVDGNYDSARAPDPDYDNVPANGGTYQPIPTQGEYEQLEKKPDYDQVQPGADYSGPSVLSPYAPAGFGAPATDYASQFPQDDN